MLKTFPNQFSIIDTKLNSVACYVITTCKKCSSRQRRRLMFFEEAESSCAWSSPVSDLVLILFLLLLFFSQPRFFQQLWLNHILISYYLLLDKLFHTTKFQATFSIWKVPEIEYSSKKKKKNLHSSSKQKSESKQVEKHQMI